MLPIVGLDKQLQVVLVNTVEDVVAVGSNKVMVVLDFLLQSSCKTMYIFNTMAVFHRSI